MYEVNEMNMEKKINEKWDEVRRAGINPEAKVSQNVRTLADELMEASMVLSRKAFDIMQQGCDMASEITAVIVELKEDSKVRIVFDN